MLVVLSVCQKEAATAQGLLEYIAELGGVSRHSLMLATTPDVNPHPLMDASMAAWGCVEHHWVRENSSSAWPVAANCTFLSILNHLGKRDAPFFNMECDCIPHHAQWVDDLEAEYISVGKPFLGKVHWAVDATGKPIQSQKHMNGVGIYPAYSLKYLPSAQWIQTVPYPEGHKGSPAPYDLMLSNEMLYQVDGAGGYLPGPDDGRVSICHATKLIRFCWPSKNYRKEGNQVVFDNSGPFSVMWDRLGYSITHGVKDDSLRNLLLNRLINERKVSELPIQAEVPTQEAPPSLKIESLIPVEEPKPAPAPKKIIQKKKGKRGRPRKYPIPI